MQKDVRLAFQLREAGFDQNQSGKRIELGGSRAETLEVCYPSLEELIMKAQARFGSLEYRHDVGEWVVYDSNGEERTFGQSAWDAVARFWLNTQRRLDREYQIHPLIS